MSSEILRDFIFARLNRKKLTPLARDTLESAQYGQRSVVACLNPHSVVVAGENPEFHRALTEVNTLLADGVGIILVQRLLGAPPLPRIAGQEFFSELLRQAEEKSAEFEARRYRCFFFGSSETVLQRIRERLMIDYPNIEICGMISPPFGNWSDAEDLAFVMQINSTNPDILWVAMTAPKQEMWVQRNRYRLNVPIIASIGAVFDFYAGTYKRAPSWACRLGIEWLFRLAREPHRMWRRNFVSTPRFIWLAIMARLLPNENIFLG